MDIRKHLFNTMGSSYAKEKKSFMENLTPEIYFKKKKGLEVIKN